MKFITEKEGDEGLQLKRYFNQIVQFFSRLWVFKVVMVSGVKLFFTYQAFSTSYLKSDHGKSKKLLVCYHSLLNSNTATTASFTLAVNVSHIAQIS